MPLFLTSFFPPDTAPKRKALGPLLRLAAWPGAVAVLDLFVAASWRGPALYILGPLGLALAAVVAIGTTRAIRARWTPEPTSVMTMPITVPITVSITEASPVATLPLNEVPTSSEIGATPKQAAGYYSGVAGTLIFPIAAMGILDIVIALFSPSPIRLALLPIGLVIVFASLMTAAYATIQEFRLKTTDALAPTIASEIEPPAILPACQPFVSSTPMEYGADERAEGLEVALLPSGLPAFFRRTKRLGLFLAHLNPLKRAGVLAAASVLTASFVGFLLHLLLPSGLSAAVGVLTLAAAIPFACEAFLSLLQHFGYLDDTLSDQPRGSRAIFSHKLMLKKVERLNWPSLSKSFGFQATNVWHALLTQCQDLPVPLSEKFRPWASSVVDVLSEANTAARNKDPQFLARWLKGREGIRAALVLSEEGLQKILSLAARFPETAGFVSAWLDAAVLTPSAAVLGWSCPSDEVLEVIVSRCTAIYELQYQEEGLRLRVRELMSEAVALQSAAAIDHPPADTSIQVEPGVSQPTGSARPLSSLVDLSAVPSGQVERRTVVVLK